MVSGFAQDFHDVIDVARFLEIERRCDGVGRFTATHHWGSNGCDDSRLFRFYSWGLRSLKQGEQVFDILQELSPNFETNSLSRYDLSATITTPTETRARRSATIEASRAFRVLC